MIGAISDMVLGIWLCKRPSKLQGKIWIWRRDWHSSHFTQLQNESQGSSAVHESSSAAATHREAPDMLMGMGENPREPHLQRSWNCRRATVVGMRSIYDCSGSPECGTLPALWGSDCYCTMAMWRVSQRVIRLAKSSLLRTRGAGPGQGDTSVAPSW